jgi:hypothetical protein
MKNRHSMKRSAVLAALTFCLIVSRTQAQEAQVGNVCSTIGQYTIASVYNPGETIVCNASNTWALVEGITSSGNVGIGTTSPVASLDVRASPSGSVGETIYGIVGQPDDLFDVYTNTTSNTLLFSIGKGGITCVNGGAGCGSSNVFAVSDNSSSAAVDIISGSSQTGNLLQIHSNTSTPYSYINSSGHVGIGTASPQATLDVNGYARLTLQSSQPVACSSTNQGAIALNHLAQMCACNGSSWIFADSVGAACSW